ncbi:MAG: diadenylate cyclase CdaA [Clostridia bacterium]|nr:diadenylate cyclase CdaA [Clostridia bacterium]
MVEFTTNVARFLSTVKLSDIIDIAIVAVIVYWALRLIRETRAAQLVKGILVLVALYQVSSWLGFNTLQYILQNTLQLGLIALLIVFQPELRRALEQIGHGAWGKIFGFTSRQNTDTEDLAEQISLAADSLSKNKIGALICIERITKLGDIAAGGTSLSATVTAELLVNIFVPNTPLHDGAVIIGDNKILAAACVLPLTAKSDLSKELGTRHRAAIGLSENSDAVVVVVSEETGKISIALNGDLTRNLTKETLRRAIIKALDTQKTVVKARKLLFWKGDKK